MKIERTVWTKATDVHTLEIDEETAQYCEDYVKHMAEDPATVPHISLQTLVQAWNGYEMPESLYKCEIVCKSAYLNAEPYKQRLVDIIQEWLTEAVWETDPYTTKSETVDWEDELDYTDEEYNEYFETPNPDFPDKEYDNKVKEI